MVRILVLIGIIAAGALVAGLFGSLYDQITYTISPEFFIKYRFTQAPFNYDSSVNPRWGAAKIGFLKTWDAGLYIGIVLGLVGLINKEPRYMIRYSAHAFLITLGTSFIIGMLGWPMGSLPGRDSQYIPSEIRDFEAFQTVINMNNFGYAGAVIGMFFGIFYQVYKHKQLRERQEGIKDPIF